MHIKESFFNIFSNSYKGQKGYFILHIKSCCKREYNMDQSMEASPLSRQTNCRTAYLVGFIPYAKQDLNRFLCVLIWGEIRQEGKLFDARMLFRLQVLNGVTFGPCNPPSSLCKGVYLPKDSLPMASLLDGCSV